MRRCAAILLLGILACKSSSRDNTLPGVPTIAFSPTLLSFSLALPRFFSEQNVTISSRARVPLRVISLVSSSPVFQVFPPFTISFDVSPGQSRVIRIRFVPTGAGSFTGTLTINTDDPIRPSVTVFLSGTASFGVVTSFGGFSLHPDISVPIATNPQVFSSAVFAENGDDGTMGTADDRLVIIRDTSPPTVSIFPLPFIANQPVGAGNTGVAVPTLDPDGPGPGTSQIQFIDVQNLLVLGSVSVPGILFNIPSQRLVRWTSDVMLTVTPGADGAFSTGDEELVMANRATGTFASAAIGSIATSLACRPFLVAFFAAICSPGPDNAFGAPPAPLDDRVLVCEVNFSTMTVVLQHTFVIDDGYLDPDASQLDMITKGTGLVLRKLHVVGRGADGVMNTADDLYYEFDWDTKTKLATVAGPIESPLTRSSHRFDTQHIWFSVFTRGGAAIGDERYRIIQTSQTLTAPTLQDIALDGAVGLPTIEFPHPHETLSFMFLAHSTGPDNVMGNGDDRLYRVTVLSPHFTQLASVSQAIRSLTIANLMAVASQPVLFQSLFLIPTEGADSTAGTEDDALVLLRWDEAAHSVELTGVRLVDSQLCRPLGTSSTGFVLLSPGTDGIFGNGNDAIVHYRLP